MAGRFTNLQYDPRAYNERTLRSVAPANYRLDPNYAVNVNTCFSNYGPHQGLNNSVAVGQQIDVDSVLRGISQINSKSNLEQIPDSLENFDVYDVPTCPDASDSSNSLETQYSRYTHPSYDIKGLNVEDMRFEYPFHDPQCQIFENYGVNTRLYAKDNHRATWQVPIDQGDSLPSRKIRRPKKCTLSLNCNYAPF